MAQGAGLEPDVFSGFRETTIKLKRTMMRSPANDLAKDPSFLGDLKS